MKPSVASYRLWLLVVFALGLTALLGARISDTSASAPASHLFDSRLAPAPTATPGGKVAVTPTRQLTATPGGTATPPGQAPALAANGQKRYLPLVMRFPTPTFTPTPTRTRTPTPTSTPTRTPTPFPTPGQYGWKGIGDTWEAEAVGLDAAPANQFWGLVPNWWYDWGYHVRDTAAQSATGPAGTLAILEAGLKDIGYVPMIYCPQDAVSTIPSPQQVADLARRYPGRVWLLFNEPDNSDQCGASIKIKYSWFPPNPVTANPQDWKPLGKYLGEQYALYYNAIKAADPAAKVFAFNPVQLPLPTLSGLFWPGGVSLWNAFLEELANQGRPLDGVAIHAYPSNASTYHTGCQWFYYLEPGCVQEALVSAYKFFQGTDATPSQNLYAALTRNKPIWITEIGTLAALNAPVQGQPLTWARVRDGFEAPMLNWLKQSSIPGGNCAYINGVSWFSTYCKDPNHSPPWWDNTASNLLDHLSFPTQRRLTDVGAAWRDANCPTCQCPGPGCP